MRRYLLDTTILAAFLLGRRRVQQAIGPWIEDDQAATRILVYGEVVEYLQGRSDTSRRQETLRELLQYVPPYVPTLDILDQYAAIRRLLRPPSGPGLIGDIDTIIAATALVHGLTVVSTDSDFVRVPRLLVMAVDRADLRGS